MHTYGTINSLFEEAQPSSKNFKMHLVFPRQCYVTTASVLKLCACQHTITEYYDTLLENNKKTKNI